MQLKDSIQPKNEKTKEFIDSLTKSEGTYVKDGNVFKKTEQGILFLGPLSKIKPERCHGCEFLIKKIGRDELSEDDGSVFWHGGCILKECVEDIIREKRRFYLETKLGSSASEQAFKRFKNSMWADKK